MTLIHDNVKDALETGDAKYRLRDHADLPSTIRNPDDFAEAIGYPIERITKTLFLRSHDHETFAVVVCSMNRKVDFKASAKVAGVKRLEVAPTDTLQQITGYPRNGVSPLGLPQSVRVLVDEGLLDLESVLIGGGATGIEVEIAPTDLIRLAGAITGHIAN